MPGRLDWKRGSTGVRVPASPSVLVKPLKRVKMRVDAAFLNVFNHPNFGSVDPFIEDAGYTGEAHGFALPSLTSGGDRLIKFGVKVLF